VESILTLDRLRQSVAVKELLQARGQPLMRKTASVPNFSQVSLCFIVISSFCSILYIFAHQALETKNGVGLRITVVRCLITSCLLTCCTF
jgi:hypothetical protein